MLDIEIHIIFYCGKYDLSIFTIFQHMAYIQMVFALS